MNIPHDLCDDNSNSKYKIVIRIEGKPIVCQVDLGSEATLIRKSDAEALGLRWSVVEGPWLRGLGNVPYIPLGKNQVLIEVQNVIEQAVEVFVVDE